MTKGILCSVIKDDIILSILISNVYDIDCLKLDASRFSKFFCSPFPMNLTH